LYFGTVDATALWVCLLHDAWRWGTPADQVEPLLGHLKAALGWLVTHGDPDGDGFLEYVDDTGSGLSNQGWKDSGDSVRFRDGRLATAPIALCEVQGYAHKAAVHGADLLEAFGRPGTDRWRHWAAGLEDRFRDRFWVEDPGGAYPALALDADKRPVDSLISNVAHLLGTGLLNAQESLAVAARLASPTMSSGYGLRTMGTGAGGYGPLTYHCGLLAAGEGFRWRLPELYSGDPRAEYGAPVAYPAACRPRRGRRRPPSRWWAPSSACGPTCREAGSRSRPCGPLRSAPWRSAACGWARTSSRSPSTPAARSSTSSHRLASRSPDHRRMGG
jgi:hypothetical protein